jgi:hypothetical protein
MEDQNGTGRLARVMPWVIILLMGTLAVMPLVPPRAPAGTDPTEFSTARAMETIERIAAEPHPMGSPAAEGVRIELDRQIRALGLEPESQTIESPDYFGGPGELVSVINVMARIPGRASTGAVALVGHYDTVPTSPGANDNASAVAVILETARAILAGPGLRNDVILLFTDGEEPAPRFGSTAFVSEHPWAHEVKFVINLESIGSGGPSTPIATNGPERWIIDRYAEAAPYPAAFSYLTATTGLIGGSNTDFAPFRDRGASGLELAYLHGSSIYHTLADAPDRVSMRSLHQEGSNSLALTRDLADLDLAAPEEQSEVVFFTLGRFLVVRYPATAALPIVLVAAAALAAAVHRRRAWRRLVPSMATTLLAALVIGVLAVGVWTLLAGERDTMGIAESYAYLAGLLLLAVGTGTVMTRLVNRRTKARPEATGRVATWLLLALLIGLAAPGIGYLFAWPALVGALTLLTDTPDRPRWQQLVGFAVVSGITLALLVPAIDTFYQLAQPRPGNTDSQMLFVIAIPAFLMSLVVEMIRSFHVPAADRTHTSLADRPLDTETPRSTNPHPAT